MMCGIVSRHQHWYVIALWQATYRLQESIPERIGVASQQKTRKNTLVDSHDTVFEALKSV